MHAWLLSQAGGGLVKLLGSSATKALLSADRVQSARQGVKSVAVKVSASGRLDLRSEVRTALRLGGPGHVVITVADGSATLTAMAENLARIRALARPYAPKGRLASEELIAERPEEARREAADPPGTRAGRTPGAKRRGLASEAKFARPDLESAGDGG